MKIRSPLGIPDPPKRVERKKVKLPKELRFDRSMLLYTDERDFLEQHRPDLGIRYKYLRDHFIKEYRQPDHFKVMDALSGICLRVRAAIKEAKK